MLGTTLRPLSSNIDYNYRNTNLNSYGGYDPLMTERERAIRSQYGFKDKDQVSIFVLPKGKKSKRFCSFTYTPQTVKAQNLSCRIYRLKGKIASAEYADMPPKERQRLIHRLRGELRKLGGQYAGEMADAPKVATIVLEEDESQ